MTITEMYLPKTKVALVKKCVSWGVRGGGERDGSAEYITFYSIF